MKKLLVCVSALLLTGCSEWLEGAAKLTAATAGVTWPGAFLVVGVCLALAWALRGPPG
jgi:hypothetical protein